MKKIRQSFSYTVHDSAEELGSADRELLSFASDSAGSAYAPYSHFHVGAAIRLKSGKIVTGNNQENMAFPSGLCAERVALFAAASGFPGDPVKAIAVTARTSKFKVKKPVPPCGACRQALIEYEMKNRSSIRMILRGETGKIWVISSVASLLPLSFREDGLLD